MVVIVVDAKPKFLDGAGIGSGEGSVDVGATRVSFGDNAFGDRPAIGERSLRRLEDFECPEQVGLLFLAKEAKQGLQALAIIIIVPHLTIILRLVLEQHQFLKEQRGSLEDQPSKRIGQDRLVLLVHPQNYK